jgi:hypothetical protein
MATTTPITRTAMSSASYQPKPSMHPPFQSRSLRSQCPQVRGWSRSNASGGGPRLRDDRDKPRRSVAGVGPIFPSASSQAEPSRPKATGQGSFFQWGAPPLTRGLWPAALQVGAISVPLALGGLLPRRWRRCGIGPGRLRAEPILAPYRRGVTGSNPVPPTLRVQRVASMWSVFGCAS